MSLIRTHTHNQDTLTCSAKPNAAGVLVSGIGATITFDDISLLAKCIGASIANCLPHFIRTLYTI